MLTKEQAAHIMKLADDHADDECIGAYGRLADYLDSITAPEWNPTDAELTTIYKTANNEVGKGKPITTQRIFTAMRAMLSAAPKPGEND